MNDVVFIWVCGYSSVGKTSLVKNLQKLLSCDAILTGEILRKQFPLLREIPDDVTFQIISDLISKRKTNIIILDNFPFSHGQYLKWILNFPIPKIIFKIIGPRRERTKDNERDSFSTWFTRKIKFDTEISQILKKYPDLVSELNGHLSEREILQNAFTAVRKTLKTSKIVYSENYILPVQKLSANAILPLKKNPYAVGNDIFLLKSHILEPYKTGVYSVGLSVEIPTGHCAVITSRSSASLQGLLVHVGIVDPAFSESLKVIVTNLTKDPISLLREIAVAQLVFIKTFSPQIKEIETIKTDRSGFGSSNHE